jgi:hypothetical protein
VAQAIADGDGTRAERLVRKALFDSRDGALATLRTLRGEAIDPAKFIRD